MDFQYDRSQISWTTNQGKRSFKNINLATPVVSKGAANEKAFKLATRSDSFLESSLVADGPSTFYIAYNSSSVDEPLHSKKIIERMSLVEAVEGAGKFVTVWAWGRLYVGKIEIETVYSS